MKTCLLSSKTCLTYAFVTQQPFSNPDWNLDTCIFLAWSPWWRHQMDAISTLLALSVGNSPVTGEFPSQRASDAELWCFLWSSPWMKGWLNNGEADYLRRHCAHYDVILMTTTDFNCLPWNARRNQNIIFTSKCRFDVKCTFWLRCMSYWLCNPSVHKRWKIQIYFLFIKIHKCSTPMLITVSRTWYFPVPKRHAEETIVENVTIVADVQLWAVMCHTILLPQI